MKNIIYFLFVFLFVFISCNQEDDIFTDLSSHNIKLKKISKVSGYITVEPSTDISGVTDANNIEAALNEAKVFGGTVYLTDGDKKTVDHFYTSRNIIVENFNGMLKGEDMESTIIHAGRQSAGIGFEAAIAPYWLSLGYNNLFANVLQLDNATGDVVISNLTIMVEDDQPTNVIPDANGNDATYLATFIEILGGEHNTVIKNVRLKGKESEAFGNVQGMNTAYGIHVMLKPLADKGKGNLTVRNVDVENIGNGAILFMKYKDGSKITIDDVRANNVGQGIRAGNIDDSSVKILNMDISLRESGFDGMWIYAIPSGLEVSGNSITNGNWFSIGLAGISNAQIVDNTIIDHNGCCWWAHGIGVVGGTAKNLIANNKFINMSGNGGGIFIWSNSSNNLIENNDYKFSNIPGWTEITPNGPGALLLGENTQGNKVTENKFPPNQGVTLCEMVLDQSDDASTPEYDGSNFIHHWQPCENLPEIALTLTEHSVKLHMEGMLIPK